MSPRPPGEIWCRPRQANRISGQNFSFSRRPCKRTATFILPAPSLCQKVTVAEQVSTAEESYEYLEDGILVVEGGKVKKCGAAGDVLLECGPGLELVDCSRYLIMPGTRRRTASSPLRVCRRGSVEANRRCRRPRQRLHSAARPLRCAVGTLPCPPARQPTGRVVCQGRGGGGSGQRRLKPGRRVSPLPRRNDRLPRPLSTGAVVVVGVGAAAAAAEARRRGVLRGRGAGGG